MADNLLKTILYELVVDADGAIEQSNRFEANIAAIRKTFDELQAQSGDAFNVIKAQIESVTVAPLQAELAKLKAELKAFESSEFAPLLGDFIGPIKAQIDDINEQLRSIPIAFQRIKNEASQIDAPIRESSVVAQEFTANVADARTEMMELVQQGYSLQAAFQGVKGQDLYKTEELTLAKQQVKELIALQQQLNIPQQTSAERAQQFTDNVALAKSEMSDLVKNGYSLQAALEGVRGKYGARELTQATRELKDEMGGLAKSTSETSKILRRIFAAGIIGFVLGAIRGLIQGLKEAAEAGAELSRSFLDIAIQARALKREGGGILPTEWIETAKELSKTFTQFAQKDINSAVSQLIRLGRQSGLTDKQIQQLITDTLTLATVTGQDAADAANAMATAVESGYARGLKEVIGAIDETTLAQEAIRRGLAETEDQVDKNVRATVVLMLAQEEMARIGDDLSIIQESLTGQYTANKNEIKKLTAALGERLLPILIALQERFIELLTALDEAALAYLRLKAIVDAFVFSVLDLRNIAKGFAPFSELANEADFMEIFLENFQELAKELGLLDGSDAANAINQVGKAAKDTADDVEELSDELRDALIDIRELFIDLYQDISDEQQKFEEDSLDAADAYAFDLLQLNRKLQYDIGAVWRGYYDKLAEETDDYRDREIEEEKKYQEKLRKLRENFLLDLEDALRERDARQIIRLIRQYNLRKTQLERERKDSADERKRDFEDQKEDLARQRDIRLRELAIENEQRKALMAKEFEEETRLREEEHKRRLAEEREQAKERLDELLRRLVDEGTVTEEQAQVLAQIYDSYFGTNGDIGITLDEFISKLEETAKQAAIQMGYIGDAVQSVGKSTYGAGPEIPDAIKMINPPEGAEIPDALKTLEGLDIEFDDGRITQEAQKVTQVLEDEFGEDGAVSKVYDEATAQASTFVNESIPETFSGAEQQVTESAGGIAKGFTNAFGPGSTVEGTYLYLIELISNVVSAIISSLQAISQAISNFSSGSRKTTTVPEESPFGAGRKKMARGGTMFANTPTTVTFGEAGPEIAQFTPLNRSTSMSGFGGGGIPGRNDSLNLRVTLSPDLEARIIDSTLDQTARVIFDVERTQR